MTASCNTPPRPQIGTPAMLEWILAAAPGDRLAYWRGHLAVELSLTATTLSEGERRSLLSLKNFTLSMAEAGLVHLVQQRLGADDYLYLAIARPQPRQGAPRMKLPGILPEAAKLLPQAA